INRKQMIHAIVSDHLNPKFIRQNIAKNAKFFKNLQDFDQSQFKYSVLLHADGQTFTHISHYEDVAMQEQILNDPSFLNFQKQRDDSGLEESPKVQVLEYIGSAGKLL